MSAQWLLGEDGCAKGSPRDAVSALVRRGAVVGLAFPLGLLSESWRSVGHGGGRWGVSSCRDATVSAALRRKEVAAMRRWIYRLRGRSLTAIASPLYEFFRGGIRDGWGACGLHRVFRRPRVVSAEVFGSPLRRHSLCAACVVTLLGIEAGAEPPYEPLGALAYSVGLP